MQICDMHSLAGFVASWYGVETLARGRRDLCETPRGAEPLQLAWRVLWQLFGGAQQAPGPAPLATQDWIAGPDGVDPAASAVAVVCEENGRWQLTYLSGDGAPDPKIYARSGTEPGDPVPTEVPLSDILVSAVLMETVKFGSIWAGDVSPLEQECTDPLWRGPDTHAVAAGEAGAQAQAVIRANPDRSLLSLDCGGTFSGFVAQRTIARERFRRWRVVH